MFRSTPIALSTPAAHSTANPWDGETGGIVALQCQGTLSVNGSVTATGIGYRGGTHYNTTRGGRNGQGEGYANGRNNISASANGNGGGGGRQESDEHRKDYGGGGGGGNGTAGGNAEKQGAIGGAAAGNQELTSAVFGGGGGVGGGPYDGLHNAGRGGNGGGNVFLFGRTVTVTGSVVSAGWAGRVAQAVVVPAVRFVAGGTITINANTISASGGVGDYCTEAVGRGGNGGVGRIRVDYCIDPAASITTNPAAYLQKVQCHIAEQVENGQFNQALLVVPQTVANGATYVVDFGRRHVFVVAGTQDHYLRVQRQLYSTYEFDVQVSQALAASGQLDVTVDVGRDGTEQLLNLE